MSVRKQKLYYFQHKTTVHARKCVCACRSHLFLHLSTTGALRSSVQVSAVT